MSLSSGSRLGPYEILSPIGAGGMGEVYRARDTRLSREVAVKVLPSRVAPTPEARERFEREARTIAQLSHPHICVLHDVGREGETEYLVMELLDGESLTDRLGRGPLPLEQALRVGADIASALAAAHVRGIVHRDLKPGNVMLTRTGVKLLDFGLARAFAKPAAEGLTEAPTVARDLTAEGSIVGTVAYMAPEQLEGRDADARTDIFALGAVLYEMLTGRKAFSSASQAGLISAILTAEPPPVSSLQPVTPPELDRLVRTCLAKDASERWQSAHDVELQLRSIGGSGIVPRREGATTSRRASAGWAPWALAAVFAVLAAAAFLRGSRPDRAPSPTVRFSMPPPEGGAFQYTAEANFLAVSPDGSQIAYVAQGEKDPDPRVWLRALSSSEARPIPGTEGASSILWSPDGRSIAFFTRDRLKRVDAAGGAAVPICDIPPGGGKAGTWGRSDILFTTIQGGALYRVPASGGQPLVLVRADTGHKELRLGWPWFLADGERFLYLVRELDGWGNLMLVEPGRPPRPVARLASFFQYVAPGYLLYSREGTLVAQRFDAKTGSLSGEPIPVAERVRYFYSTASAGFAGRAGTIAYLSQTDSSRLVWFDRGGREIAKLGPPGDYLDVHLTADGKRLFFDRARPGLGTYHVWSYDLERGVEAPVTTGLDTEAFPRLLADGRTLIFSAVRGTPPLLRRRDMATGKETALTEGRRTFQIPQDVSPDGRTLVFVERTDTGNFDIWALSLDERSTPVPILQSPFEKQEVRFSPDGKYIAFVSNESGRREAYLMPFPGPGERVRVSNEGAQLLHWARDGALYYLSEDGRVVALPVRTSPALQIGAPSALFKVTGRPWTAFDVSDDARRFLAVVPEIVGNESSLHVIVGWRPDAARP